MIFGLVKLYFHEPFRGDIHGIQISSPGCRDFQQENPWKAAEPRYCTTLGYVGVVQNTEMPSTYLMSHGIYAAAKCIHFACIIHLMFQIYLKVELPR